MRTLVSINIPTYNSDEMRVKSKLKMGLPLSEIDKKVVIKEIDCLKDNMTDQSQIDRYLEVKYPGILKLVC